MSETAVPSEGGTVRFPPGAPAPTAADRIAALKDPDRLAKLNAGKAEWYAKPKEERQRITAERQAVRLAKQQARQAKRNGGRAATDPPPDSVPPTVRSTRSSLAVAPPDSEIPRPGVRGGPLKGLLDLCEALPKLGDGTCFIQVTRVKPPVAFGIPCAGTQKPLWEPVDDAEFAMIYGGAEYSLRGYTVRDDGRTKALTEPVTYKVSGAPNLDSALTEEDAMRPQAAHVPNGGGGPGPSQLRRPGLVTPHVASAEAEMYDRNLTHQETMDERNARRDEEKRRRVEDRERAERQQQTDALKLLSDRTEREAERAREMYEQRLAEKGGNMAEVAELLKVLKPDGEQNQNLLRQHASEIKQLTEAHRGQVEQLSASSQKQVEQLTLSHRQEVQRLTEMHAAALQRLDDQMRADRDRSDKLIRETDQRSNEQIREAERRADQRVTDAQNTARTTYEDLKTRSEERLRDQASAFTQRIEDMRDNHARELKRKDDELVLMRTGLEGNVAIVLANKETELKRLERELREAKALAEANKDWVGQMEKAEQQALALGYEKPDPAAGAGGDEDLKTTAAKAGLNMLGQLPQIIESATNAYRNIRNPVAPPDPASGQARAGARGHTRQLPRSMGGGPAPVQLAPLAFATEDGGYLAPTASLPPAQMQRAPAIAPLEQSSVQAAVRPGPEIQPQPQEQPPPQAAAAPQEQMSPAPALPAAPVTSPAPASVAPPPSPAGPEINPAAAGLIQNALPNLASAFSQRVAPQAVAESIVEETGGVENARVALSVVTLEQVLAYVGQDQAPEHAALKTRNGQKFLRDIWRAAEQLVATP